MLGLLENFTSFYKYPHKYEHPNDVFHLKKKEYHLYDYLVFMIITIFLIFFFYTILTDYKGATGYIYSCVAIVLIYAILY